MVGRRQVDQGKLFYEFSLETHIPADHFLRGGRGAGFSAYSIHGWVGPRR